jgi:threonine aldolase
MDSHRLDAVAGWGLLAYASMVGVPDAVPPGRTNTPIPTARPVMQLTRRMFLGSSATAGLVGLARAPLPRARSDEPKKEDQGVQLLYDGVFLSPVSYARLLERLAAGGQADADTYMSGGVVAHLEDAFASALGKERACFVPTGTLANHLAIRTLARDASRVLVPAESHIYNDSSDCVEVLSHLNLVPLGASQATFTLDEVKESVRRATDGPFPVRVGALVIECPVRRKNGQVFDFAEMKRVSEYARGQGMGLHLDGARLYIASAYTGVAPAEYATLFDTVYISLYKYFGAAGGAILAGPRPVIEAVARARKLFGAGVLRAWPEAAVALHYFQGFPARYQRAVETARALFAELEKNSRFKFEGYPGGTNIFRLHAQGADLRQLQANLRSRGILTQPPRRSGELVLFVNETLNQRPVDELVRCFTDSLPAG